MSDIIDDAQRTEEQHRNRAIQAARNAAPVAAFTGECLECGERVEHPRRWCNAVCRDDWERRR